MALPIVIKLSTLYDQGARIDVSFSFLRRIKASEFVTRNLKHGLSIKLGSQPMLNVVDNR